MFVKRFFSRPFFLCWSLGWLAFAFCTFSFAGTATLTGGTWPAFLSDPKPNTDAPMPVLGGTPSKDEHVVGIYFDDPGQGKSLCSGVLLSANFVLTAEHCTCHESEYLVSDDQFLSGAKEGGHWTRAVLASRFNHDGKDCKAARWGADLALLHLEGPFRTASGLPICQKYSITQDITPPTAILSSKVWEVSIGGYGVDDVSADKRPQRRVAAIRINSFTCGDSISRKLGCFALREFVAGARSGASVPTDSCEGDSGGPAYLSSAGHFVPIGLVSRGLPVFQPIQNGKCGAGGIYTHVGLNDVRKWINSLVPAGFNRCR